VQNVFAHCLVNQDASGYNGGTVTVMPGGLMLPPNISPQPGAQSIVCFGWMVGSDADVCDM
jgi:hypothetical protein